MSCWMSIQTELRDLAILQAAAEDLGLGSTEINTFVAGYSGQKTRVALALGPRVGFRWSTDSYEMVGDFASKAEAEKLLGRVTQAYARRKVLRASAASGFHVVREEKEGDVIVIEIRKCA